MILSLNSALAFGGFALLYLTQNSSAKGFENDAVGHERLRGVTGVAWERGDLPQGPFTVYRLHNQTCSNTRLKTIASQFNLIGSVEPVPLDFEDTPAIWIRELDPVNPRKWRCVSWSKKSGEIMYDSGDDGFRYDPTSRQVTLSGVPTEGEALLAATNLMQKLHISPDLFEMDGAGRPRCSSRTRTLTYRPRGETNILKLVQSRTVTFWQKVKHGRLVSFGDGGTFEACFISGGKLSEVHWNLPELIEDHAVLPLSKERINNAISNGQALVQIEHNCKRITINKVDVYYALVTPAPDGSRVYPYYKLSVAGEDQRPFTAYLPIASE
jgi:hypothetical protein